MINDKFNRTNINFFLKDYWIILQCLQYIYQIPTIINSIIKSIVFSIR